MTSEVWLLIYNRDKINGQITREVLQTICKVLSLYSATKLHSCACLNIQLP